MKRATENILFADDFSSYGVRVLGSEYTPAGEYHCVRPFCDQGRWRETVVHHSYAGHSRGNWQVVLENDGQYALEQTAAVTSWCPMLAAGGPVWRDVTVTCEFRPLTEGGWRAVIFRYRHSNRFYALAFAGTTAQVIRRDNDVDTIMGEAACVLDPDRYAAITITCRDAGVVVAVDGGELLRCADNSPQAFAEGCVAFAANQLTRFRHLHVKAPAPAPVSPVQRQQPVRPTLWKKFSTPDWGTDRNLRVADINGDGQPEIVLARRTDRLGGDNFSSITGLAAFTLEGERLWTIGEPGATRQPTTSDLCFQLHDWDGDGRMELVYCRDWELIVAEAATGKLLRRIPLPRRADRDPAKPYRVFADSLYFCDLTGSGRADSLLVKDRYKNLFAHDRQGNLLWSFAGNIGHYPFARDVDGDGRDEVAIGHHLLDHDGTLLWSAAYPDHADNVALVDVLTDAGTQTRFVMAGSDAGFRMLDLAGNELLHYPIGHAQSLCYARVLPERDDRQFVVNTYWGPCGITATLDEAGRLLHECEPMPYACLLQPVNWVPRVEADLILLSTHPREGGLINGHGERLVMFPDDGHPFLCSDARDLDGDGVDEVLTWDEQEIWIYKADVTGRDPSNYPQRNSWHNDSNYRAQLSLPASSRRR